MATIITTDDQKTTPTPPARSGGLVKALVSLGVVVIAFVLALVFGDQIKARLGAINPIIIVATAQANTVPTTRTFATAIPRADRQAEADAAVKRQIDTYNATAQAQFDAAVQAPLPVENVGQGEPAVLVSKPADRQPAGENVPTSLPIEPQAQSDNGHGTKSKPVNIQETKTCLHGQVWIDGKGCRNPTPVAQP